uniref:Protein SPT2 homolog n=1 Tax=Parastrongyloides trichosuri TaxID=131310 RepID=A0A0N4Z065_PARTI
MDDLLGEILSQVQATKKSKPVVKEYKSAKRLAEEREIAEYEAEKREREKRNKLFEKRAKERALEARIREEVKKNRGRVTARMAKEFGMDLLVMQERYGSDVDVLRKLQHERERESLDTDWQRDKYAHGALKTQKLREQLAKNKKITAAAKVVKKAINFDEMVDDLTSREGKKIETRRESVGPPKISQGQNLSFNDLLRKATQNKSVITKQSTKIDTLNKEKKPSLDKISDLPSSKISTTAGSSFKNSIEMKKPTISKDLVKTIPKEGRESFGSFKKETNGSIKKTSYEESKKEIPNRSKRMDEDIRKNSNTRESDVKKINPDRYKNISSSSKVLYDVKKDIDSKPKSLSSSSGIKIVPKTNGTKSGIADVFKRPSDIRKEMREQSKNNALKKESFNSKGSSKKNDIEMDKIRALQERERKKEEIFKKMRELEALRNEGKEIAGGIKEKKKEYISKNDSYNNIKNNKSFEKERKRPHGIYDDYSRKKVRKSYDEYEEDDYDSEDSLADFIDDDFEEEVPDRKTMKEALRSIAKNYDADRWRENERRISERDMIASFRDIDREEKRSLRIGYKEDLEEAKRGSEAL